MMVIIEWHQHHPLIGMTISFNPDQHLSPAQLVERWADSPFPISLVTLARWRRSGHGPAFIKAGHRDSRVFYPVSAIEQYESTLTPNA